MESGASYHSNVPAVLCPGEELLSCARLDVEFCSLCPDSFVVRFNDSAKAYIEVMSFDRLVNAATERNRAFFDKLGLPSGKLRSCYWSRVAVSRRLAGSRRSSFPAYSATVLN